MNLIEVQCLLAIMDADEPRLRQHPDPEHSVELDPCHVCGGPAVRRVALNSYCGAHLAALYGTFDPSAFVDGGVGLPCGVKRDEFGPGVEDLRCGRCDATWAGVAGDPCDWCQRSIEQQREHQARLALTPPDVDPDDTTYAARMQAWGQRMKLATDAELITRSQAETAWRRAVTKTAA